MLLNLTKLFLMKNKILVTGGSGFIGTNFINYLLKKNYDVINLDYQSYSSVPEKFIDYSRKKNYLLIKKNIKNTKAVQNIFKKNNITGVFNFASQSHVDRSINNSKNFILENVSSSLAFIDLISFLSKKKLFTGKFINISTDEVYGTINRVPSDENFPMLPNSPYAASKACVDLFLRVYNKTFGMPFINIRCCNNYGPYQFTEKFIPTIILSLLENKKIPVYGNGKNRREWIFVLDFCRAIEKIYKNGKINNTYNVGSENRISNLFLIKKIKKIFKSKFKISIKKNYFQYVNDRPGHDLSYKINSNKIQKELNWQAKVDLDKGLENTISWYIKNKKWIQYTKQKYKGERLGFK
jgi:dTDP-glucose 4,6-dehydratase